MIPILSSETDHNNHPGKKMRNVNMLLGEPNVFYGFMWLVLLGRGSLTFGRESQTLRLGLLRRGGRGGRGGGGRGGRTSR